MQAQRQSEKLQQILQDLQISFEHHRHPPLFSVADSQKLRGEIKGGHCKNLLTKDRKNQLLLLVCLEDSIINLKSLPERLPKDLAKKSLSLVSANLLQDVLGVFPGSVSPFALINDSSHRITVVLDDEMMQQKTLNFHPLINTETLTISTIDLLRFIAYTGHAYHITSFTGQSTTQKDDFYE